MISIARETLVFRRGGISPPLSLLIPTFAFPDAPARVVPHLQSGWNAPLPIHKNGFHGFGIRLHTRLLSMRSPSTSELLRTL